VKYKTGTVSLTKLILRNHGVASPLCNHCTTKDCTNVIEKKKVSVFGVNKTWRVQVKGAEAHVVVRCDGFSM
jgi:hypothetical protein